MSSATQVGQRAVVLGASMAGLLAARVLADFFAEVVIVERDHLTDEAATRPGVPQANHAHALLGRGARILEALFPGLLGELVVGGVPTWNDGELSGLHLSLGGHLLTRSGRIRDPRGLTIHLPSRALLESRLRRRVRALGNATMFGGRDAVDVTFSADLGRVTGARVVRRAGGEPETWDADLVVDATGRGSRTPALLESRGYGRPVEDEVVVQVCYVSQWLRMPAGRLQERMVLCGASPDRPTAVGLIGNEADRWAFTVAGFTGRQPPRDRAGMLKFAEPMIPAHVLAALRDATPLGPIAGYRIPSNRWRRYDRMRRFPAGLLVTGDAVCSFNPVYGQGMTVAALDAEAMRCCLGGGLGGLPRRYFAASAKPIGVAWQAAAGSDLSIPGVAGSRGVVMRLTGAYTDRVLRAAERDPVVAETFLRVMQLIDAPQSLLAPGMIARAVTARARPAVGRAHAVVPRSVVPQRKEEGS